MSDRTKKDILTAFNNLISQKDFDSITVRMITEEADISKATFYRHFQDKYDVMNYNYKLLLDHYGTLDKCDNYRDLFFQLFDNARTNWDTIKYAFESTGFNSFQNFIYDYSYRFAEALTESNRDGTGFTEAEHLQVDVFCRGVAHMYKNWVFGEYELTSDEAADALYELLPESLKHLWWA